MLNATTAKEMTMEQQLLDALLLAIRALNQAPSFGTGIPDPAQPRRMLSSYELIPQLEAVARKAGRP